jgi:hypothetical protein
MHSTSIFFALFLTFIRNAAASATFCSQNSIFCVTGWTDNSTTCLAVSSKVRGWAGLGIGSSQMAGSDMYVGWKNSSGIGYTVTNLRGVGREQPLAAASSNIASINNSAIAADRLDFTFCLRDNSRITPDQSFIFAYSFQRPDNPDSTTSPFAIHDFFGTFRADFTTSSADSNNGSVSGGAGPALTTENFGQIVLIHAWLMWIAWILFSCAGIFTARYLKSVFPDYWFPIHKFFMGIGSVLVSLIAFIILYLYKTPPHFSSTHEKIGLSILVFMIAEAVLGWIIDKLYDPARLFIPLRDKVHWWFGRSILVLAVINVQLGFDLFNEKKFNGGLGVGYVIGNWFVVGLFVIAALYMEWKRFWSGKDVDAVSGQLLLNNEHHENTANVVALDA